VKIDITPGLIITAIAMLIFYFRIAQLRGFKRRLAREEALERRKKAKIKGGKKDPILQKDFFNPQYKVRNWALVGVAVFLMLAGVTMYTANWFPAQAQPYWWIAASGGVLLLAYGIV
jgi:cytochrome b subunit of formate dehydrogenase